MSFAAALVIGGSTLLGTALSNNAAKDAARAGAEGTEAAIAEQRYQFDQLRELLAPYAEGGEEALAAQQALIGLAGEDAQRSAIESLQRSPQFTSLVEAGENALLQNAAATGNLRGGNVKTALAEYRPQVLNSLIQQQYQNLGSLSSLGQNAAAGTGNAGVNTGANIGNLLTNQAEINANSRLARARSVNDLVGNLTGVFAASGGLF